MALKKMKTLNFGGQDTYKLAPDWADVENAPFGTKVETVEILAEQNTVAYADLDGNEQSKGGITKFVDIANGTVCYVTINDVVFKGVAERGEFGDTTGNLCVQVVICDNPENPTFLVQLLNDNAKAVFGVEVNGFAVIVNGDNAINAETLSISTEQETVTPIPQKYLPEPVVFYLGLGEPTYLYKDADLTEKATKEDVLKNKDCLLYAYFEDVLDDYCIPLTISNMGEYIMIFFALSGGDDGSGLKPAYAYAYTAEYTG